MKKLAALIGFFCATVLLFGHLVGIPVVVSTIVALLLAIMLIGAFIYFRKVWFFRDPVRKAPTEDNIIVSPADGRIMYIRPLRDNKVVSNKIGEDIEIHEITRMERRKVEHGWLIGIYMTPFDVHFNYAPIPGKVEEMVHSPSKLNLPMVDLWEYVNFTLFRRAVNLFCRRFHFTNERMTIQFKNDSHVVYAVLIADKFVNKIETFVTVGEPVDISQRVSFIGRGSQVDIIIPNESVTIEVKEGIQVYGGRTIVGRIG